MWGRKPYEEETDLEVTLDLDLIMRPDNPSWNPYISMEECLQMTVCIHIIHICII